MTITITITVLSLLTTLTLGTFVSVIPLAFAEEVITILPGSTDKNRPSFLDMTFYPIEKGKELTWFNNDDVNHSIVVNSASEDNKTILLVESETIKPEDSFTYTFEEEGTYHFSSPTYPWIKGTVFVSDDISTITQTDSKNDVDVQLSWTPSSPVTGQPSQLILRLYLSTRKRKKIKSI